MTRNEVWRLSRRLGLNTSQFAVETGEDRNFPFEMKKESDGKCIFLRERGCSIYDDRPLVCKCYPFSIEELTPDLYAFEPNLDECPGIGDGGELRDDFFRRLLGEALSEFQRR